MYGIEKRKKSIFFSFHAKVFRRKTGGQRRKRSGSICQSLHSAASVGWRWCSSVPQGHNLWHLGAPIHSGSRGSGTGLGTGWPWGGEEGDCALEFEGDRGGWGQGLPCLGPSLHPGNPSLWEEWASGLCLKHLGEDAPGSCSNRLELPPGSPGAHGPFYFCPASVSCYCPLLWPTHSPGKPFPD